MTKAELLEYIQIEFDKFIKELLNKETILEKLTKKVQTAASKKASVKFSVAKKPRKTSTTTNKVATPKTKSVATTKAKKLKP